MAAAAVDFSYERKLMNRWAYSCLREDDREVNKLCGLTPHGSPPNVMDRIYVMGPRKAADVTGYADAPTPPPDAEVQQCHEFMSMLLIMQPEAYEALLCRHRRLVHGEFQEIRSETAMAIALYGLSRAASWDRLRGRCELGYAALRRWLESNRLAKTG